MTEPMGPEGTSAPPESEGGQEDGRSSKAAGQDAARLAASPAEKSVKRRNSTATGTESTREPSHSPAEITPADTQEPHAPSANFKREWRKTPLAVLGAVAGVLALLLGLAELIGVDVPGSPLELQSTGVEASAGPGNALSVIVPRPLASLSRPPPLSEPDEYEEWKADLEASYADEMAVDFYARSEEDEPTIIRDVSIEVLERRPLVAGTWITARNIGGSLPARLLYADLDASPPSLRLGKGLEFPLQVSRTDIEAFTVLATARDGAYSWRIRVDAVTPDGDVETTIVDDNGRPFMITGSRAAIDRTFFPASAGGEWPPR